MNGFRLRAWRGLDDIPGMGGANGRLRAHVGLLDSIDIASMAHRYTHLVNSDPAVDCRIAERHGGTIGYARVEWHDLVDGDRQYDVTTIVEPAAWGLGVADGLLEWGEARIREIAATQATDRRSWYQNEAFGGDTELEDALRRRGYAIVRWGAEMLRPNLEDIADVPLASGYELRSPEEAEVPAVFDMLVAGFHDHWGEHEAGDARLDEWAGDPRFRRDLVVVAWRDSEPGSCVTGQLVDAPGGTVRGLVAAVATHPDHRRRGLATAAITECLRRLRDAGATSAYLGVDNHNRAVDLYEACGFSIASSGTTWRRPLQAAVRA
jgi:mycothiol synthase